MKWDGETNIYSAVLLYVTTINYVLTIVIYIYFAYNFIKIYRTVSEINGVGNLQTNGRNTPDYIAPNSPDLNLVDYEVSK